MDGMEKCRMEGTNQFENIPHIADFHLVTGENSQESCFDAYHRALKYAKALAHSSSLQIKQCVFYSFTEDRNSSGLREKKILDERSTIPTWQTARRHCLLNVVHGCSKPENTTGLYN